MGKEVSKCTTEKEYLEILRVNQNGKIINYQDLAMVILLWRGVRGNEYSDIANFKKDNIDFKNKTMTHGRTVTILSDVEIDILNKALDEKTYLHYDQYNKDGSERIVELVDASEYFFRPTNHYNSEQTLSYHSIKIRLSYFFQKGIIKSINGVGIYTDGAIYNSLKRNDFKKMRVSDLDYDLKFHGVKVAYTKLKNLQDNMLFNLHLEKLA